MGVPLIKRQARNPAFEIIRALVNHGLENVGLYYSCYRAFVYSNDDPENLQRLQLIIPQVSGNQYYSYWAFPKGVFYGEGYGTQVLPQRGDTVWVEFEGGKPEIPIWSHGHPARKEMPKNDEELKDKNCYWLVTPQGHKVKINDTKNTIHIFHKDGQYAELNEKAISLVSDKAISLGSLDESKSKAVLGDEAKDLLQDINKILKEMHGAMVKDIGVYTSMGFANTVKMIPKILPEVTTLTEKLDKILSEIVTLD